MPITPGGPLILTSHAGGSGGGGGLAPKIASILITNSELLNMSTVPAVIIPSPGPGKYISPQATTFQLNVGTIPFQIANSGAGLTYLYWLANGFAGSAPAGFFYDSIGQDGMDYTNALSQILILGTFMSGSTGVSGVEDQPLVMSMDDALSVGNGTMLVTISYTIVTIQV